MSKITKILLVILVVLLVFCFFLTRFVEEQEDITSKVGSKIGGGELSVTDYYTLSQCVTTYRQYLVQKDYETAYKMLHYNYREYTDYDAYREKVSKRDNALMQIVNITPVTKTTYHVETEVSGETIPYTILIDSSAGTFSLLPENFLYYEKVEKTVKQKGIKCTIQEYLVNVDQTVITLLVENTNRQAFQMIAGEIVTNLQETLVSEAKQSISPQQMQTVTLTFATDYSFAKQLNVKGKLADGEECEFVFVLKK